MDILTRTEYTYNPHIKAFTYISRMGTNYYRSRLDRIYLHETFTKFISSTEIMPIVFRLSLSLFIRTFNFRRLKETSHNITSATARVGCTINPLDQVVR